MVVAQAISNTGELLKEETVRQIIQTGLKKQFAKEKILVLIPDNTRSLPLPFLFRELVQVFDDAEQLDFMVALGTHPPLSESELNALAGISNEQKQSLLNGRGFDNRSFSHPKTRLLNHEWNNPEALTSLGFMEAEEFKQIAGDAWHPSLPSGFDIKINKAVNDYGHIVILGPTFPHEVAGFSGGAKYLFPGISGPEMIDAMHWLGALSEVTGTIGIKRTPVRLLIERAADFLQTPVTLISLIVEGKGLGGIFIGDLKDTWSAAADLSAERHINWQEKSYSRIISCPSSMYKELWTAAKAMYKLESVVALGGELVIYAPDLKIVSEVHGKYIYETGYHCLPFFLHNWDHYKHIPLSVLAHSTHVRGSGKWLDGLEHPNIKVTLASQIPEQDCKKLNLGYLDPAKINLDEIRVFPDDTLIVRNAGEILYRLKS